MDDVIRFQNTLEEFWHNFKKVETGVTFKGSPRLAIPYCLHGDEGRGKGKKPILVLSLQAILTSPDMSQSNLGGFFVVFKMCLSLGPGSSRCHKGRDHMYLDPQPRHSLCTRLLLAVVPSVFYAKDATVDAVLAALVADLIPLQNDGVQAPKPSTYFILLGTCFHKLEQPYRMV